MPLQTSNNKVVSYPHELSLTLRYPPRSLDEPLPFYSNQILAS